MLRNNQWTITEQHNLNNKFKNHNNKLEILKLCHIFFFYLVNYKKYDLYYCWTLIYYLHNDYRNLCCVVMKKRTLENA